MAYQNTREPYDLSDGNYGEYCVKLKDFLAGENSLPHRPTHMVAEQIIRADAYILALDEFNAAETLSINASQVVKAAVKGVAAKLLWFKYVIPTLIIGPDTLVEEFGLGGEMPVEYAEIKNLGDEVCAHWDSRKLEPIFAPILADGDLLAGLLTSYDNAITGQNTAHNLYSAKSFAKNEAREAHNQISQEIFNWYRANYTDPQNEYWIKTPWGKSPGGSGEPEEPEEPEGVPFPGPMGLFKVSVVVGLSLTVEVILTKIIGCPRCVLEREQDGSGVWEYITEYNLDADEILPFRDRVPFPGIFHYRATPYNELGEPGISSEDTVEVT